VLVVVLAARVCYGQEASALAAAGAQVRVKDIAALTGATGYRLLGYGLVVGLAGTGDSDKSTFTTQSLRSLLEQMGMALRDEEIQVKNVAAVMVTAEISPFSPVGSRFDATVSSLGDAASLQGGTLLATALHGGDGTVCAMAQGPVSIGGFGASGRGGGGEVKNHLAVGRAPQGGWVTLRLPAELAPGNTLCLSLHQPDFTTAVRVAQSINAALGTGRAQALDATTVQVGVGAEDPTQLMARLEDLCVGVEAPARVVINERTGTVVMGGQARILPVAIAHGGLTVRVKASMRVSQPPPRSGGQTVVVPDQKVQAQEGGGPMVALEAQATLQDLVQALNALEAKPRDLIAIIQALKQAGALQAELVVM
jgi:flagellar P-ring protein FlgI